MGTSTELCGSLVLQDCSLIVIPDYFIDSDQVFPWLAFQKSSRWMCICFRKLGESFARIFFHKENGVLGGLAWGSLEGPQRKEKGGKPLSSSRTSTNSEEKSEIPVTSLSLWKSGLVMPRAAQILTETEAVTCPERLSISGEE